MKNISTPIESLYPELDTEFAQKMVDEIKEIRKNRKLVSSDFDGIKKQSRIFDLIRSVYNNKTFSRH